MDWIFSIKTDGADSTADEFTDLMREQFETKKDMGAGLNPMQLALVNSTYDKTGNDSALDKMIEKDDSSVDANLNSMREFYGEEELAKMTPEEFYKNYKKFASGLIF